MAKVKASCSCGATFMLEGQADFITERWEKWQARHTGCQDRAQFQVNPKEMFNRHRDKIDQGRDVSQEVIDQAMKVGRNWLKKVL